jgi:hypothetical protein
MSEALGSILSTDHISLLFDASFQTVPQRYGTPKKHCLSELSMHRLEFGEDKKRERERPKNNIKQR